MSCDYNAACKALAALLLTVDGVAVAEDNPGGVAAWLKRPRKLQSYFEVDYLQAAEVRQSAFSGGYAYDEQVLFTVEGWTPFAFAPPNGPTAHFWRSLCGAVKGVIRTSRTLGGTMNRPLKETPGPQTLVNDRVGFNQEGFMVAEYDTSRIVLCHHTLIQVTYELEGNNQFV